MTDISLILVSHNKPDRVWDAINSVLAQTHPSWEAVLVDSGALGLSFFSGLKDPRFKVIESGETRELAKSRNMASWCFNKVLNSGMLKGELMLYLCDDDLYYPNAFELFWGYYTRERKRPQAMYASEDFGVITPEGQTKRIGRRVARKPAGRFCGGKRLNCRVDYLQFCHTRQILAEWAKVHGSTMYHVEDVSVGDHADGVFMEGIGALTTVYPVPGVVGMNRRTIQSGNCGYYTTRFGYLMMIFKKKLETLFKGPS